MATAVLANVGKGSHRATAGISTAAPVLASVGQGTVTYLPLIVFLVLLGFFFFLRLKTEEATEHHIENLNLELTMGGENSHLQKQKELASAQTAWPDLIFKSFFASALASYVLPPVFLSQFPNAALSIYKTWIDIANLFERIYKELLNSQRRTSRRIEK